MNGDNEISIPTPMPAPLKFLITTSFLLFLCRTKESQLRYGVLFIVKILHVRSIPTHISQHTDHKKKVRSLVELWYTTYRSQKESKKLSRIVIIWWWSERIWRKLKTVKTLWKNSFYNKDWINHLTRLIELTICTANSIGECFNMNY
jgi:hypothetical protein